MEFSSSSNNHTRVLIFSSRRWWRSSNILMMTCKWARSFPLQSKLKIRPLSILRTLGLPRSRIISSNPTRHTFSRSLSKTNMENPRLFIVIRMRVLKSVSWLNNKCKFRWSPKHLARDTHMYAKIPTRSKLSVNSRNPSTIICMLLWRSLRWKYVRSSLRSYLHTQVLKRPLSFNKIISLCSSPSTKSRLKIHRCTIKSNPSSRTLLMFMHMTHPPSRPTSSKGSLRTKRWPFTSLSLFSFLLRNLPRPSSRHHLSSSRLKIFKRFKRSSIKFPWATMWSPRTRNLPKPPLKVWLMRDQSIRPPRQDSKNWWMRSAIRIRS